MDLGRGMGYGHDPDRRQLTWGIWAALAAVLAAFVGALFLSVSGPSAPAPDPAAVYAPATPYQSPPVIEPPARPEGEAPTGAWSTLLAFMNGWQSTSKTTRQVVFERTATDQLTEGLALTETGKIVTQPVHAVTVVTAGDTVTVFRLRFDGLPDVTIQLILDPEKPSGWVVSDVGTA